MRAYGTRGACPPPAPPCKAFASPSQSERAAPEAPRRCFVCTAGLPAPQAGEGAAGRAEYIRWGVPCCLAFD